MTSFTDIYSVTGRILGKGAFSQVVKAVHKKSHTVVAVKIFTKDYGHYTKTEMKELKMVIKNEVEILQSMNHPHIVRCFGWFEDAEKFYVVMDFVEGGSLENIGAKRPNYTENDARTILKTVASALNFCVQKGVIHRDVKLENVVVQDWETWDLKIVDFNLSKRLDPSFSSFTLMQTACGTPGYMAPEVYNEPSTMSAFVVKQTNSRSNKYNYKCDIWSLGVMAFVLLSGGYFPFRASEGGREDQIKFELKRKVMAGQWDFTPEKAWRKSSRQGKDFVSRLLVKDKKQRLTYEQLLAHEWINMENDPKATPVMLVDEYESYMTDLSQKFSSTVSFANKNDDLQLKYLTRGTVKYANVADTEDDI